MQVNLTNKNISFVEFDGVKYKNTSVAWGGHELVDHYDRAGGYSTGRRSNGRE